jgi:SAM-dependent methyltransferase
MNVVISGRADPPLPLAHLRDRNHLTEIRRILAPGGLLYVIDYNLPEKGVRRLVAMAFTKLDNSEEAYEMVKNGNLAREIKRAGFEIKRRDLTCQGIIQLLEGVKKSPTIFIDCLMGFPQHSARLLASYRLKYLLIELSSTIVKVLDS